MSKLYFRAKHQAEDYGMGLYEGVSIEAGSALILKKKK